MVNGSPIVTGTATAWSDELVGAVLQVDGDPAGYASIAVVGVDKLVLSRGYGGPSRSGATYAVSQDGFGQLHDQLVHLVRGGPDGGPVAARADPDHRNRPGGERPGECGRDRHRLGWRPGRAGLQVLASTTGSIRTDSGSATVTGTGTSWDAELVGMALQVGEDGEDYTIAAVNSPTQLILEEPYVGRTGAGKAYAIVEKPSYTIASVDVQAQQLTLDQEYAGPSGDGRAHAILATLRPTEPAGPGPRAPRQRPLDLILLGALHPAIAQMLGLYWADLTAVPGQAYDYLLVANRDGRIGRTPQRVINRVEHGLGDLDAYIVFNKQVAPAPPLAPPDDVRVFALSAGAAWAEDAAAQAASDVASLRLREPVSDRGVLLPGQYHMWRAGLGSGEQPTVPTDADYQLVTNNGPVLLARPQLAPQERPTLPPDWLPARCRSSTAGFPRAGTATG